MSFFLVPIEGAGTSADPRRPKYMRALGVVYSQCSLGDSAVVFTISNASQDAAIAANADVRQIPPLDNVVAVAATQQALEDLNIPSQWVVAGMTYRSVLRVVIGMAQLVQRMKGMGLPVVIAGNLDKTMSQFSAAIRQGLSDAAVSLDLDVSGISGATTLREALRNAGEQFVARGVALGDL